jgi:ankyrin repeat protein
VYKSFLIFVISGKTALMNFCSRGHLEITRFLVESGANLEAKDEK